METKMILSVRKCMQLNFCVKNQFCLRIYVLTQVLRFITSETRTWSSKTATLCVTFLLKIVLI